MDSSLFSELTSAIAALLAGAAATALAGAALAAAAVLRRGSATEGASAARAGAPAPVRALRRTVLAPAGAAIARAVWPKCLDVAAAALRRAGHPGELSPEEVLGLVAFSAVAFLVAGACTAAWLELGPLVAPAAGLSGAAYPLLWLRDRTRARRAAIARALPYHLDLLTLSVEAGLDFTAAVGKVVEKGRRGPLHEELSTALKELKLGKTREQALCNLAARVDMAALTSLVQALVQADRMGTPLGKVLRALATQMRIERTQRAEKLAAEAPVKLLLPLIGCIFPTIFLMLFGPIAYQVFLGGSF